MPGNGRWDLIQRLKVKSLYGADHGLANWSNGKVLDICVETERQ